MFICTTLVLHMNIEVSLNNILLRPLRHEVLKNLYSGDSMYKDYNLIIVGHSLGGGCAQVLSLMLRPSFPSLRCYAYEPPVSHLSLQLLQLVSYRRLSIYQLMIILYERDVYLMMNWQRHVRSGWFQ